MRPDTFIFDMDGVLCDYDLHKRLRALQAMTGIPAQQIHNRVWGSGFEDQADIGTYQDSDSYLDAFCQHLQHRITRQEWIEARAASMTAYEDVLEAAEHLGQNDKIAVLTNNVPLLKDTLEVVFPRVVDVFGAKIFFSCDMAIGKPDPEIYRRTAALCGSSVEDCLFTDDKLENVEGAITAGMQGIHFTDARSFLQKLRSTGTYLA